MKKIPGWLHIDADAIIAVDMEPAWSFVVGKEKKTATAVWIVQLYRKSLNFM